MSSKGDMRTQMSASDQIPVCMQRNQRGCVDGRENKISKAAQTNTPANRSKQHQALFDLSAQHVRRKTADYDQAVEGS